LGIFLTGGLVTGFSVVRVIYLSKIDIEDGTWTEVPGFIWTVAEMCGAVISASLPTLRPLFLWTIQHTSFLSKSSGSTGNSNSYAMNSFHQKKSNPRKASESSLRPLKRKVDGSGPFQVIEEFEGDNRV